MRCRSEPRADAVTSPTKRSEALLVAREQIERQKIIIAFQSGLLSWALGDGPLPRDEEAERAAWGYLRALAIVGGLRALAPRYKLVKGLLTSRCPDEWQEPTMPWSEAVRRLRTAAEQRRAAGRIKEALRRAVSGDRLGTIRALRGALDVYGEGKVSDYARLQWRIAEAEAELRELNEARAIR